MDPIRRRAGVRTSGVLLVSALSVALTACGASGGGTADGAASAVPDKAKPISLRVGDIEGAPASFLAFGVQKGFFADHGLDVQVVRQQGGAAIIPGLVSGDLQIGGSNVVSMFLARSRGLKVQIIAPGTSVGSDPEKDFSAVVVAADSPIKSARDLDGKTIAVNTLKNVNDIVINSYLQGAGVDIAKVKFTELPFPSMVPAVVQHRVDAALAIEPFVTIGQSQNVRTLFRPYVGARPNLQIGTYSATETYIRQNPGVVKAFQEAAAKTADYITAHADEYRTALPSIANVSPELAPKVNIPVWRAKVDMESLQFYADRMVQYGLVSSKPDVNGGVYTSP